MDEAQPAIRDRLGEALHAIVSLRLLAGADGKRRVPAVELLRATRAIRDGIQGGRLGELTERMREARG